MSNNQAHPEKYHAIEAVIRMSQVKRWHMVDTTRQQTLAEHTCNVAMLAMAIASTAPGMYFGSGAHVAAISLVHDVGEVFTGDVPTPTKRANPDVQNFLDELEFAHTPREFQYVATPSINWLVKMCDLADGIRFIRRYGHNDVIAKHAQVGLEAQIECLYKSPDPNIPEEVRKHVQHQLRHYIYEMI